MPLSATRTDVPFVAPIVRLTPGTTKEVAEQQLKAANARLAAAHPDRFPPRGYTTTLRNYLDVTVASGEMATSLNLLLGGVAFLLLIACANVANLQLARGTARAREMAVRLSIGAARTRLLRQLLTESVVLSLVGGVVGVGFAFVAIRTIVGLMPEFYVPNESRVTVNVPVLWFSLAVSLLTGIVFGLVPALQTSKTDVTDALRAGRSTGAGSQGGGTRNILVVAEVALSVVLLVSAGLTARTFFALQNVDPGFKADNVLVVGVPLPPAKYPTMEQRNRFAQDLLERVGTLPGVEAATFGLPFGGPQSAFTISGETVDDSRRITVNLVGADHLRTYAIPLRAGRMLDIADLRRRDRVAVINEAASKLWTSGHDPIGSRMRLMVFGTLPKSAATDVTGPQDFTIVGVVGNTRNDGLRADPVPAVMIPYTIIAQPQRVLAVRGGTDPNMLLNPVRAQVRAMDAEQPLGRPITMAEIVGQEVVQPRFTMTLFAAFAALGLALAAAGIYSVLSFHVTRRTHELGVRMALGAPRRHILGLMLGMGGRLVGIGLAVGIVASLASTRLLRSQLFGVQAVDPLAYAVVILLLAAVALLACYVPARRAAAVDPMIALRQE
jgi:putative ABC transport system permease protein